MRYYALFIVLLANCAPCRAASSLDFDRGNGTVFTDQYTGAIGGGWTTPWTVSSGTTGTPTVISTTPLAEEGGNYLSVSGLTGINRNVIRQYGNTPDFSVNAPHTISWQWRLDSPFTVTSQEDRINFFANSSAATGGSTSTSNSWTIGVAPTYMGHSNFYFYDRQIDSTFTPQNAVNTGIPLVQGSTYSFTVSVDPLNDKYDALISDGVNSFSQTGLNTRSSAFNSNFLHFGGKVTTSGRVLDYSLDSLSLSGSPADPNLPTANGFRGIWYAIDSGVDAPYNYKYSGGFATYPQQMKPMAYYAEEVNKTFFVYGGTNAANSDLLHMISYYDHTTGEVARPRILLSKGTTDAHDNPTMNIGEDGHIYIFSASHGTARPAYINRSVEPYSIDQFEQVLALPPSNNFSYSQPLYVEGEGFMFLHTQYTGSGRTLKFNTSADGITWDHDWATRPTIAQMPGGQYQVSEVNGNTVGTMFNYHPGSVDQRTNLYYMQTTDMGATWTTANGTVLTTPVTSVTNAALIHNYQAEGRLVYLKDLQYDSAGNPVLMYLTSSNFYPGPVGDPRTLHIAHFKNGSWDIKDIFSTDHNYDFGSLYIEPDGTWRVIAPTADGPQPDGTGGDMVMWLSSDEGETWTATRQLTHDSEFNHTYARRPVNANEDFYAFWADGNPLAKSESRLYFTDKSGTGVWQLPWEMEGDFATPELAFSPILLTALDGDFNHDDVVDAADYAVWRDGYGSTYNETHYGEWRSNFGANSVIGSGEAHNSVPEPASWVLVLTSLAACAASIRRLLPRQFHTIYGG